MIFLLNGLTINSYLIQANCHILPYFKKLNTYLEQLKQQDLQAYYNSKLNKLSVNTIYHHHASINSCLDFAVTNDIIDINPATRIKLPKKPNFYSSFYSSDELKECFAIFKDDILEPVVLIAGILGLRRSEILGLTWDCIDFKNKTLKMSLLKAILKILKKF